MCKDRTRSEYRILLASGTYVPAIERVVFLANEDRDALAELLLASYRNTIDDEDKTIAVASTHKQSGLGRRMVETSLASLALSGVELPRCPLNRGNSTVREVSSKINVSADGKYCQTARYH